MPYPLITIPLLIAFITQGVKVIVDLSLKRFTWSSIFEYGGMPSGHSSLVSSLATVTLLQEGITSPFFAISLILAIIVLRDAFGLRQKMSEQTKVINQLVKDLPDHQEYKYPFLGEKIGHTFLQVSSGAAVGVVLTLVFYYLV